MFSFGLLLIICSWAVNNVSSDSESSKDIGILISGGESYSTSETDAGTSVNLLSEDGYYLCSLPRFAGIRRYHTQTGLVACGGGATPDFDPPLAHQAQTCDTFTHGRWKESHTLLYKRWKHTAWDSPLGVILMGGYYSPFTTELLNDDGGSEPMFPLTYHYVEFCAIGLEDKVILTGGYESKYTAEVYNIDGFVEELPQLQTQHYKHGCGHYINNDNQIVYMVTSGVSWPSYTPSTEILVEGGDAWSFVGELPFGFSLMQVTSLNNRLILTGGYKSADDFDFLMEYDKKTTSWEQTGLLQIPRHCHGASVIELDQLMDYCE